ncbi:MAG: type II secretion system protein [Verrucomicrobiota bacterium]
MSSTRHAFTLVELLVTITIMAVLAGVGIPLGKSMLAKSREAACIGQLRNIGSALQSYLQDHQQKLPDIAAGRISKTDETPVLETVLKPYLENEGAFKCPQDTELHAKSGSSYLWNNTQSGRHITQLSFFGIENRPDKIPLVTDKESWHPNGVNVLYADSSSSNKLRFATGN